MRRSAWSGQRPGYLRLSGWKHGVDPWLCLAFLGLMCFGILMVYSSSVADAYAYYGTPYYFVEREMIWAGIGALALLAAARLDYRRWQGWALPIFAATLLLLFLVMLPHVGHSSNGAQRWIALSSSITIEPSELMKLGLVIYLAAWLAAKGRQVRDFKACFVPFSLMVGIVCLLIVKQPDLGTTMVVGAIAISVYFIAGADMRHLILVSLGATGVVALLARSESYRHSRLTAFLNPWADPTGTGYHTIQALLALRYGGLFGVGLGNSIQKYVLPEPHTDSILAVIGEEWGLVGTAAVLLMFLIIGYRGMRIAVGAPDAFGRLLAAGITSWITFQALLNFAVITSSVPFTGVPLPFISYGGSSLIISMTAMGILLNISRQESGEGFARQIRRGQSPDLVHRRRERGTRVPRVVHQPLPTGSGARRRRPAHRQPGSGGAHPLSHPTVQHPATE